MGDDRSHRLEHSDGKAKGLASCLGRLAIERGRVKHGLVGKRPLAIIMMKTTTIVPSSIAKTNLIRCDTRELLDCEQFPEFGNGWNPMHRCRQKKLSGQGNTGLYVERLIDRSQDADGIVKANHSVGFLGDVEAVRIAKIVLSIGRDEEIVEPGRVANEDREDTLEIDGLGS